jgi:hypothetical protein
MLDELEGLSGPDAPYRPGAVADDLHASLRSQNEAHRLEKPLFRLVHAADALQGGLQRELRGNWKLEPQPFDEVRRLIPGIHRGGKEGYPLLPVLLEMALEVSQLLTAERSPVTTIDEEHGVARAGRFRKRYLGAVDRPQLQGRKGISGIQKRCAFSSHRCLLKELAKSDLPPANLTYGVN